MVCNLKAVTYNLKVESSCLAEYNLLLVPYNCLVAYSLMVEYTRLLVEYSCLAVCNLQLVVDRFRSAQYSSRAEYRLGQD